MTVTALDPRTALVLIDLQNGVLSMPLAHPREDIVERANTLAAAFRDRGLPVVLVVVDGSPPGRTEAPRFSGTLPPGWTTLVPELLQQPGDLHVVKQSPGAFAHTDLEALLTQRGVTQVVIAGVATGGGVDSTARQAYELGFNVTLAVDAMTDGTIERHEQTIAAVFPRLGETGTAGEILQLLRREAADHE